MYDVTKLVSKKVWKKLLIILPTPRQKRLGRKKCKKEALLKGAINTTTFTELTVSMRF